MSLFDTYLIVDWSAANAPKRGKDSIWIAETVRTKSGIRINTLENPPTRSEAIARIEQIINIARSKNRRLFAGFDFPFGYPAGAASLVSGEAKWSALWSMLACEVEDAENNRSNRYELAARWNRDKLPAPFYWGHPHQHTYDGLGPKRPATENFRTMEYRIVERWAPPAKSVWQLAYNGAVGSQAMLGIARLEKLRRRLGADAAIWPFQTRFDENLSAPIVIAEVYPSLIEPQFQPGDVKDAAQVRTVAKNFARLDRACGFGALLARPAGLDNKDARKVMREEGWIVGAGSAINLK
ncbi:MAG: cobalamin biosynthesis protein CbiG [Pseudomonadota bacterium]